MSDDLRMSSARSRGEAGAVLSADEMAFRVRFAKWNDEFAAIDAVTTAAARWHAYKRWLLTPSIVGPRMDITTDASLDAFADALITRECDEAATKAAEVIR